MKHTSVTTSPVDYRLLGSLALVGVMVFAAGFISGRESARSRLETPADALTTGLVLTLGLQLEQALRMLGQVLARLAELEHQQREDAI